LIGKSFINIEGATLDLTTCPVTGTVSETEFTSSVKYQKAKTSKITSIEPDNGTAAGGTEITITGTGFTGATTDNTVILIDEVPCVFVSATDDVTIVCTTGKRDAYKAPTVNLRINDQKALTL
jgi:hypothetical protein